MGEDKNFRRKEWCDMLTNPVVISVLVMTVLCLFKMNVIVALIVAALVGGMTAGIPLSETMNILIGGMGGNSSTALSYILLGALAASLHKTGIADILSKIIVKKIKGRGIILIVIIAVISCFSQNLIPVHIAFIPILIPPLVSIMNKLKIDRRAVACALTFGLKTPYVALPVGFGWIFHGIISSEMGRNGMKVAQADVWKAMWLSGLAMIIGLFVAIFISYRKPREYKEVEEISNKNEEDLKMTSKHWIALAGAVSALVVQLSPLKSLHIGALLGIGIMVLGRAIDWNDIDSMISEGIKMMGFIAFVMLVAAGYGEVIRATGGVEELVKGVSQFMGGSKLIGASAMILLGLLITMGIGTSFGTIPIIAAIYVPLAASLGFSTMATVLLIGVAAALGDAGSPASDSTLGPTSGLNIDGQHDHIWDTCVPTFLHYNIPLVIFGVIGAMML